MPNHPPAPVQNLTAVLGPTPTRDECKALKDTHMVKTRAHDKGAAKLPNTQSHHILQNAAVGDVIPYASAQAVLLPTSTHKIINKLQRERNCPGPAPTTLGPLLVNARDDLATAFKADKPQGLGIKDPEATDLANCVASEAADAGQAANNNELTQDTGVNQPKGCVAEGTLVWLEGGRRVPVEEIRVGMVLSTRHVVLALGGCGASMVEIVTPGDVLVVARQHRVRMAMGEYRAAGRVSVGEQLLGAKGPVQVLASRNRHDVTKAFSVTTERGDVRIGRDGVWIEGRPAEPQTRIAARSRKRGSPNATETP